MKQQFSVSSSLGLTQEQLALQLKVSRQLLSLYELGKRSLPLNAELHLAELLSGMQNQTTNRNDATRWMGEFQNYLKSLLRENEYRIALTQKKLRAMERKLYKTTQLAQLSGILAQRQSAKGLENSISDVIAIKASETSEASCNLMVLKLQLENERLEADRMFLESKLKELK